MKNNHNHSILWKSPKPLYRKLDSEINTDILIIGGGMTGLSAAYHLRNSGLDVVLVERGVLADVACRGTGVLSPGLDMDFIDFVAKYSPEDVRTIIGAHLSCLRDISGLVSLHNMDCEFITTDALVVAHNLKEVEILRREYSIRKDLGLTCKLLESNIQEYIAHPALAVLVLEDQGIFNQSKFIGELSKICSDNIRFFENTEVLDIQEDADGYVAKTHSGRIRASKIILAGGGFNLNFLKPRRNIDKYTCYVITTRPLDKSELDSMGWHRGRALWPLGLIYDFARLTGDNRVMVGGEESRINLGSNREKSHFDHLRNFMINLFPSLRDVAIDHSWCGDIYYTKNELPEFGRKGNIFYSFAYAGNGLLTAFEMGRHMASQSLQTNINKIIK